MSKTAVVYTCAHADPKIRNERFNWLGNLIYDLRPDYVVDLGDGADMRSLNTYDTGKPDLVSMQNYEGDINSYNDSQERLRHKFRKYKRRKPDWFGLEGNHEHRITRYLDQNPRLKGENFGISMNHLNHSHWFNEYTSYSNGAPDFFHRDGIDYAHFIMADGSSSQAIAGKYHAAALIEKRLKSTTVGHSHKRHMHFRDDVGALGCVAGCFKGGPEHWAGQTNHAWWHGVVIKHNIEGGLYDPEWVSMERLKNAYGS